MKTQTYSPSTLEISAIFHSEITALSGSVSFEQVTAETLFLRAVLPKPREVKIDDRIHHGVAVRTDGPQLMVHPYSFREICTNGAIHITDMHSKVIKLVAPFGDTGEVIGEFRQAIQSCGSHEAFEENLNGMRETMNLGVRLAFVISSMTRLGLSSRTTDKIIHRFISEPDRSGFGLMNAITSTARDTRDEEEKWKLETVGGGIIAWLKKPVAFSPASLRKKIKSDLGAFVAPQKRMKRADRKAKKEPLTLIS